MFSSIVGGSQGELSHHARSTSVDRFVLAFYWIVVIVSGVAGCALLAFPESTGAYFSWSLGPDPVASLVGGLYLASAALFFWALRHPDIDSPSVSAGVLGLAVPTLSFTIAHHDVFDWTRWQALGWLVLFGVVPVSACVDLVTARRARAEPRRVGRWGRGFACGLAAVTGTLALSIWLDPTHARLEELIPFALTGLSGRYVGAWCSFIAVVAAVAAIRGRRDDHVVLGTTVFAMTVGILVAAGRSWNDLGTNRVTYAVVLLAVGSCGFILRRSSTASPTVTASPWEVIRQERARSATEGGPRTPDAISR